ncbi:MAG: calcium/sodium antiporter [Alphaproteobacteria bacterium]|jgi:cation:H+ antiporter|nr:calcium/sodium antiporter [Alphaproteobacteria bacterium]
MPDIQSIAALVGGLILLGVAGEFLVGGAVSLGRRIGVSPLVAGIFIVGFGTSAPEMLVAVDAAIKGYPELAQGNIVGSNIANVWLVLGLPAIFAPLMCGGFGEKRSLTAMLIATCVWIIIGATIPLHAGIGAAFILGLIGYAVYTFVSASRAKARGIDIGLEEDAPYSSLWQTLVFVAIGIVGLPLGAHFIVTGGVEVADALGIPDYVIGLTLIAVGTSLPELGAAVAAVRGGNSSVIIGNVLGSNIFNILGAGGLVALFSGAADPPVRMAESFQRYDHWAMGAAALTIALFILPKRPVTRLAGVLLLLVYALYIYGLTQGWNILALFAGGNG